MEIHEIFKGIDDPRIERTKLHMLEDIFGLTLIAVVCGIGILGVNRRVWKKAT